MSSNLPMFILDVMFQNDTFTLEKKEKKNKTKKQAKKNKKKDKKKTQKHIYVQCRL